MATTLQGCNAAGAQPPLYGGTAGPAGPLSLADCLTAAQQRMAAACARAGRKPEEVEIIGVTKTFGPDVVAEAWQAGLRKLGENRIQEAAAKIPQCPSGPEWHLIGHLQRNKVRAALEFFSVIHAVDSLRLLEQIDRVADEAGCQPRILLEVNVSGEVSKFGLKPEDVPAVVEKTMQTRAVTLVGLMTMAPFFPDPQQTRPVFARLRELRDRLERDLGVGLPHLSMGMSNDFEVAVEEGATWVRLGTSLFGHCPKWAVQREETFDE
ncbi:MAG: YggS family pyridoxal phosphate-dependent enzyme [Kiritimatiellia bacterium]